MIGGVVTAVAPVVLIGLIVFAVVMLSRRSITQSRGLEFVFERELIAAGWHRDVELRLRNELIAAESGFRTPEKWSLCRTRLAQLLIGEGRFEEAAELLEGPRRPLAPQLEALAHVPGYELAILRGQSNAELLEQLQRDRDQCVEHVPKRLRSAAEHAWGALEGLYLLRAHSDDAGIDLVERGLYTLAYNSVRVAYFFALGEAHERRGANERARQNYALACETFPGSRFAEQAKQRMSELAC